MSEARTEITSKVRGFIVDELLKGKDGDEIANDTDLLRTGIVDSINVLSMVSFIEDEYDIELEPSDIQNFSSIDNITGVVVAKRAV